MKNAGIGSDGKPLNTWRKKYNPPRKDVFDFKDIRLLVFRQGEFKGKKYIEIYNKFGNYKKNKVLVWKFGQYFPFE